MATAFYAPLKPPDHPNPSGDRQVARLFLMALERAGAEPRLACRLRTYDRGDAARQQRLDALGARAAARLIRRWQGAPPATWFTYHCHHKAPDGLGPRLSHGLDCPYVVAEASISPRQATGPWAVGHRLAADAITAADVVVAMSAKDEAGLAAVVRPPARLVRMLPFTALPEPSAPARPPVPARFVTVAMMREGAKRRSYELLAAALAGLDERYWRLDVVGDGPARAAVEAAFAPVADRLRFFGRIDDRAARDAVVRGATAFLWPAVDEAYGMALLEAQALGVPAVAGDGHGVPDIVVDGVTGRLAPVGDVRAFRAAVAAALDAPARQASMGAAAAEHVRRHHGLEAAAAKLAGILELARAVRAARRR